MVIQDKLYTLTEFEAVLVQAPDALLELINGRIVEKVTSEEHGKIVINIGSELRAWLKQSPQIKGHYTTESSHRVPDDIYNEVVLMSLSARQRMPSAVIPHYHSCQTLPLR